MWSIVIRLECVKWMKCIYIYRRTWMHMCVLIQQRHSCSFSHSVASLRLPLLNFRESMCGFFRAYLRFFFAFACWDFLGHAFGFALVCKVKPACGSPNSGAERLPLTLRSGASAFPPACSVPEAVWTVSQACGHVAKADMKTAWKTVEEKAFPAKSCAKSGLSRRNW